MDPTSANQYQNLHYTFQNLALSPPPPPPSEMPSLPPPPEGAYYDDYQQHQQHDQQHPPHSQQQQQQQYYDQQSARHDVRSVGRNGWNNGGASQGQAVTGRSSNGKGGRSALPSVRSQPSFLFYFFRLLVFFFFLFARCGAVRVGLRKTGGKPGHGREGMGRAVQAGALPQPQGTRFADQPSLLSQRPPDSFPWRLNSLVENEQKEGVSQEGRARVAGDAFQRLSGEL